MRLLRNIFILLFLLAPAAAAPQDGSALLRAWELSRGEERILSFVSAVEVEPDGDLDVTETIRLVALNREINRGILRDFPTSYENRYGQRTHVGFEVISIQRNGQEEPWAQESLANGVRLRIGDADVILPIGEHTYTIRYRTTRQILYGDTFDEIYWNATGTGWTFSIDMAEARITLPQQAAFGDRAVYTGPQGATGRNAEVIDERPGYIAFRTTQPLGREEGLTVAAAFPKGVLEAPSGARKLGWWLADWGALTAAIAAIAGLVTYYLRAWWKAGRGPRAGTVVPIFAPPDGLSPAAVRYISRMGFDNRAFSAAMIWLGVKGQLHISQEKSGLFGLGAATTLRRTDIDLPGESAALPAPEQSMQTKLFGSRETIELKQKNHALLQSARKALQDGLDGAYEGTMFRKNREWAVYGLLMIVLAVLAVAAIGLLFSSAVGPDRRIGIPLLAAGLLLGAVLVGRHALKSRGCIIWTVAGVLAFAGSAAALATFGLALEAGIYSLFLPLLALPLAISAFWWMYAPTPEGRAMMDRIAGFRQYLSITEEDRLDTVHPPEKTPELFERYLPYAIALDVENRWAEKFAAILAASVAAGTAAHAYGWYSGEGNPWDDPQGFAGKMGDSFAGTVSSASSSPSSSGGGSGGGGSSGGGGGGGGGSGW